MNTTVTTNMYDFVNGTSDQPLTFWSVSRGILAGFLAILTIFVNILTILVIKHCTSLQEVSGYFMKSLAVADLCVGLILPVFVYPVVTEKWPFPSVLCEIVAFVFHTCLAVSIWSLACLSVDRYIALKKPVKYYNLLTAKRSYIVIIAVWISSAVVFSLPLFGVDHYSFHTRELICGFDNQSGFAFGLVVTSYLTLPLLSMYVFNAMIAKIAFKEIRVIKRRKEEFGQMVMQSFHRMNLRAAKTLALVVITFSVTWVPCIVLNLVQSVSSFRIPVPGEYILMWMGVANSCLNFFIYNCSNRHFSEAAHNLLRCKHPTPYNICSTSGTNSVASPKIAHAKRKRKSLGSANNSPRHSRDGIHILLHSRKQAQLATIHIGIEVATSHDVNAAVPLKISKLPNTSTNESHSESTRLSSTSTCTSTNL